MHKIDTKKDELLMSTNRDFDKKFAAKSLKRFRSLFNFGGSEQVWGQYFCYAVDVSHEVPVSLFISTNYLCLAQVSSRAKKKLLVTIPLGSILVIFPPPYF